MPKFPIGIFVNNILPLIVCDKYTLKACTFVCKEWFCFVIPKLWTHIYLGHPKDILHFSNILRSESLTFDYPNLITFINLSPSSQISIDDTAPSDSSNDEDYEDGLRYEDEERKKLTKQLNHEGSMVLNPEFYRLIFEKCRNITSMDFSDTFYVPRPVFETVYAYGKLRSLKGIQVPLLLPREISGCSELIPCPLEELGKLSNLFELQDLSFSSQLVLNDLLLTSIVRKMKNLKRLEVCGKFTDFTLKVISESCPDLVNLRIQCSLGSFSDVGITEFICGHLKSLSHLSVESTQLTPNIILPLLKSIPSLTYLNLDGCYGITIRDVLEIIEKVDNNLYFVKASLENNHAHTCLIRSSATKEWITFS